jgi:SAM-dependent methyltransferase
MEQQLNFVNKIVDFNKPPSTLLKWGISNLSFLHSEKLIDKKLNIMIAGCGTGRNAHYLSSLGHNILGFDISEENINLAQYRYSQCPVDVSFNFFVHDLKDGLPFETNTFDLIIDIFVYNEQIEIDTRKAYLREMSRVLINDGYLLLGVHSSQDEYFLTCNSLENTHPQVIYDAISKKNVLCYSDEDLVEEIEENFQISMRWMQEKYQHCNGERYLRKYLISLLKKI